MYFFHHTEQIVAITHNKVYLPVSLNLKRDSLQEMF